MLEIISFPGYREGVADGAATMSDATLIQSAHPRRSKSADMQQLPDPVKRPIELARKCRESSNARDCRRRRDAGCGAGSG